MPVMGTNLSSKLMATWKSALFCLIITMRSSILAQSRKSLCCHRVLLFGNAGRQERGQGPWSEGEQLRCGNKLVFIELDFPWRHATQIRVETHDRLDNHLDKLTAGAAT